MFLCWFTTSTWRFHSNNVSSLLFDSLKREITTFKSISFFLNKKRRNRRIADDYYIFFNLSLHCKRKALWHFKKKYTDIIDCIYAIFIVLLPFSNFIFWITLVDWKVHRGNYLLFFLNLIATVLVIVMNLILL